MPHPRRSVAGSWPCGGAWAWWTRGRESGAVWTGAGGPATRSHDWRTRRQIGGGSWPCGHACAWTWGRELGWWFHITRACCVCFSMQFAATMATSSSWEAHATCKGASPILTWNPTTAQCEPYRGCSQLLPAGMAPQQRVKRKPVPSTTPSYRAIPARIPPPPTLRHANFSFTRLPAGPPYPFCNPQPSPFLLPVPHSQPTHNLQPSYTSRHPTEHAI